MQLWTQNLLILQNIVILLGTDLTESRSVVVSLESPLRGRRDVTPLRPEARFYHGR
jgi:hypothetical protein